MKVELTAHSGSDLLVVNAARCSFGKESDWVDVDDEKLRTRRMLAEIQVESDKSRKLVKYRQWLRDREATLWGEGNTDTSVLKYEDYNLIDFLAREHHLLPFRHPQVTLRCKAPIFLTRQLGKHQVGFSWSEESRRYITTEPEFYWPDKWRKAAENVKQGSSEDEVVERIETGKDVVYNTDQFMRRVGNDALFAYKKALEAGVAPELARMILPQNLMVTWVWTGSLLGFYQMYAQRSFPTAQKEARDFVALVEEIIEPLYPVSWAALKEHQPWEEGKKDG